MSVKEYYWKNSLTGKVQFTTSAIRPARGWYRITKTAYMQAYKAENK